MRKSFDWLLNVEEKAAEIYERVSQNKKLGELYQKYMSELSAEERNHMKLLEDAMLNWPTSPLLENEVIVDDESAREIEEALERVEEACQQGTISLAELFDALTTAEWSEWNNLFIYVMRRLAKEGRQGEKVTSLIEKHKRNIIEFVQNSPQLAGVAERLKTVDKIWHPRILVVEDSEALRMLLSRVLEKLGEVETAEDGQEALDLCHEKHFDAIVSDIDMPRVDGFEFFHQLIQKQGPEIKKHFLFVSGAVHPQKQIELSEQGVRLLLKPFEISELKKIVSRLIK